MFRYAKPARNAGAPLVAAVLAVVLAFVGGTLACGEVKTGGDSLGMTKTEEFVPGEIIVWFDDAVDGAEIEAAVKATGGEIVRNSVVTPSRVILSVPEGEEDDYVAAYRKLAIVQAVDKNYVVKAFADEPAPEAGGEMKTKIGGE